ncbi:MAG: hypothetical protein KIS61_25985 [Candidatus Eremiobacteraeota bacterium]|nr:hypothetical protein [Candidatus Eremiobacteraeota bacterium]
MLMLTMLLAIITAVVASNTLQNYKTTNWSSGAGTSRYIAYAGIQHAMIKLRNFPEYNDTFEGRVPGREGFIYRVTVKNQRNTIPPRAGSLDGPSLRFNTAEIPVNCAKIESRVILEENADNSKVERSLSGMVGTAIFKPTNFKTAASARSTILMTGDSKTRAYDFWMYKGWARDNQSTMSYDGYINPDPAAPEDKKDDKDDKKDDHKMVKGKADVATSTLMQIGDTSKVEGDVFMPQLVKGTATSTVDDGSGGVDTEAATVASVRQKLQELDPEMATAMSGVDTSPTKTTNFTGEQKAPTVAAAKKAAVPPYDRAEATTVLSDFPAKKRKDEWGNDVWDTAILEPKAYKSVSVPSGQKLKLKPGRYYFADTFEINGEIEVDDWDRGDVVIYVGKKMLVGSGGRVNFQGDPAQVQVYFTDEDTGETETTTSTATTTIDPETGLPVSGVSAKAAGYSRLTMAPDAKATMVAQGNNLIAKLDKARLLGSVSGEAVWLKNGSTIEYDTNLADRQMAGSSPWRLQGVYETVGR